MFLLFFPFLLFVYYWLLAILAFGCGRAWLVNWKKIKQTKKLVAQLEKWLCSECSRIKCICPTARKPFPTPITRRKFWHLLYLFPITALQKCLCDDFPSWLLMEENIPLFFCCNIVVIAIRIIIIIIFMNDYICFIEEKIFLLYCKSDISSIQLMKCDNVKVIFSKTTTKSFLLKLGLN